MVNPVCSVTQMVRGLSLEETLPRANWLKVPFAVMRDVGPAVQTLAGVIEVVNMQWDRPQTFMSVEKIAAASMLPARTARKHLNTLCVRGWLKNWGREKPRKARRRRRTCTYEVVAKTKKAAEDSYGVLPKWAAARDMSWCSKAVLSVVMHGLLYCEAIARKQTADLYDVVLNYDVDRRFQLSLQRLSEITGLSPRSALTGKNELRRLGIITVDPMVRDRGGLDIDYLRPSEEFRAPIGCLMEAQGS